MKKNIKWTMVMILICVVLTSSTVFASDSKNVNLTEQPSEEFVDTLTKLFNENNVKYRVVNKDGTDVTEKFITQYRESYADRNYAEIRDAIADYSLLITWTEIVYETKARGYLITGTAYNYYAGSVVSKKYQPGKAFEFRGSVTGKYQFNNETGMIQFYDNGKFNLEYFGGGALYSGQAYDISTGVKLSTDKKTITYTAQFSLACSLGSPDIPGLLIWTEYFGPYTVTAIGRGEVV